MTVETDSMRPTARVRQLILNFFLCYGMKLSCVYYPLAGPELSFCVKQQYTCPRSGLTIPRAFMCDADPDCNGREDEEGCSEFRFKLSTYFKQVDWI